MNKLMNNNSIIYATNTSIYNKYINMNKKKKCYVTADKKELHKKIYYNE